jgi:pyruvate kinase
LKNFDEILETADGIIIARGYLGLDIKLEDVAYI